MSYKLSVIIATLVDDAPFRITLASCASQIGIEIELVAFVKDVSYPLTSPSVNKELINGVELITIRGNDQGIADAWNTAILHATGGHLCFLGAGDYFYSATSVREIFALASKSDQIGNVFFGTQLIRRGAGVLKLWSNTKAFDCISLMDGMTVPHASSFWPRALWNDRSFDKSFKISLDYEFTLRVKNFTCFSKFDVVVSVIEPGGLSNSPSKMLDVILEDIRARTINGLPPNKYTLLNFKRFLRWLLGHFA